MKWHEASLPGEGSWAKVLVVAAQIKSQPAHHLMMSSLAIGGLSLVLVAGLDLLGVMSRLNQVVVGWGSRGGHETFAAHLPSWWVWLGTVILSFGTAVCVSGIVGWVRRMMWWVTAMVVVAGWAPVLSLAAHAPEIAAPWIATFWSGLCAMIHAAGQTTFKPR